MPGWLPAALGLGAAGFWRTADFFAKPVAERDGSETALFWLYLTGFPLFLVAAARSHLERALVRMMFFGKRP